MKRLKSSFFLLSMGFFTTLLSFESPKVSMDTNGNMVAVWNCCTSSCSEIRANIFYNGYWLGENTISSECTIMNPEIAVIANATDLSAVAIWVQSNGENRSLYAAKLIDLKSGWTEPSKVSSDPENVKGNYTVKIDSNGNSIIIWQANISGINSFRTSSSTGFTAENKWSRPENVFNQ